MKTVRSFIALLLILISAPVWAADNTTAVQKLLDRTEAPRNLNDYANLYYHQCVKANKSPRLTPYVETQCACTASAIPAAMTMRDMEIFMRPGTRNSYPYVRLMSLAYIPCLKTSMHDYTLDTCLADPKFQKLKKDQLVCECIADGVSESAMQNAPSLGSLPGYQGQVFDMTKITNEPFPYIIDSRPLGDAQVYYTSNCIQTKEFGR